MKDRWNLNVIYKGFDDPAYTADLEALQEIVRGFHAFAGMLEDMDTLEGLRQGIAWEEKLMQTGMKLAYYAQLRQSADTRDAECGSCLGQIMQHFSAAAGAEAVWKAWAAGRKDLMEQVCSDAYLKEYTFLFAQLQKDSTHLLGKLGEQISASLTLSGSNAWSEMHSYLTSTVPVQYEGGMTNLSAVRNLAYDADQNVRRKAYEAELACYGLIRDPIAYALNSIKLETISDCRLRGYTSPLDRTLAQSYMRRETLDAMMGAIEEYLPEFRRYLKAKGAALGHKNGLPWYDLFAPMGKPGKLYSIEEARDVLVELFSSFDEEMARMIGTAFDDEWIDFYPRDGKVGGAFCEDVDSIGQSRILVNFDGQFSSVDTLAHELGHAFHNQCVRSHLPLNKTYSMPVAETASIFNECVVMAAAIDRADSQEEKMSLLESQLQAVTQIIVDIYSRYLFETMVFENRESRFMNSEDLCGLMRKAQERSYGDGLDPDFHHPYMWICKPHYYGPTFYNFPYSFGGLFARGLYAQYQKEGASFVPKYKKLLYTTPVATVEDAAKVAGIDLADKNFWRSALQMITEDIDRFCDLLKTMCPPNQKNGGKNL